MNKRIKQLTVAAIMVAIAVVVSLFSFPIIGARFAPVQHLVNILCAVFIGPWWGVAVAFMASTIRLVLALGKTLAYPGSMCGALLAGLAYQLLSKKLPTWWGLLTTSIAEVIGTGIIGGILAYPVAYYVVGNKAAALFTFVIPFLISTIGGAIIAMVILSTLAGAGFLQQMKAQLDA